MKIFVGYGYNERDKWIEELVFPLIEAFGDTPVTGKEIFGKELSDGVRGLIRECDALMGFATRRDGPNQKGLWTTHKWVADEIRTADDQEPKIPYVEIREAGIDPQTGMNVGKAYIALNEGERDRCLLALAQTISRWHSELRASIFQLSPDQFIKAVIPWIGDRNLECSYRLMNPITGNESGEVPMNIVSQKEGLFVYARNVPSDRLIRVRVSYGARLLWISEYQKHEIRVITLKKRPII
jgi:hypothetical protein